MVAKQEPGAAAKLNVVEETLAAVWYAGAQFRLMTFGERCTREALWLSAAQFNPVYFLLT